MQRLINHLLEWPNLYFTRLILKLVLGLFLLVSVSKINLAGYFPIHEVKIYGNAQTDVKVIHNIVDQFTAAGFFALNLDGMQRKLNYLPWVANSYIKRIWRDKLEIRIWEKTAFAKWNDQGLISAHGELFMPPDFNGTANLPEFIGPAGQHGLMLQYYRTIARILSGLHVKIKRLYLSPYLTWEVTLNNGVVLRLGHKNVLARLQELVRVYYKILGNHKAAEMEYIDLRYPDGVAVKFTASKNIPSHW